MTRKGYPGHDNGWLDPRGQFVPLSTAYQHCEWCREHMGIDCRELRKEGGCVREQDGWIKLTKGKWILVQPSKITANQCEFIFDWHVQNRRNLSEFMDLTEDFWEDM